MKSALKEVSSKRRQEANVKVITAMVETVYNRRVDASELKVGLDRSPRNY